MSVTKIGSALSIYSSGMTDPPLTEQKNIAFAGTLVCSGRGRALVVAIGANSEFGKIAKALKKVESRKSPLQLKIDELGKTLAYGSSIVIVVIGVLGWFLGRPLLETITVAVSLAVAAIPEGLPICVTVTLALGVLRMARSNAIVKKLTSVETLGCATVVCSDKTGTLTQNEMTVRSIFTLAFPKTKFTIDGVGYNTSNGSLLKSQENSEKSPGDHQKVEENSDEFRAIQTLFAVASICNNATIGSKGAGSIDTELSMSGQPTELALLVGSAKVQIPDPRPQYHRLQEIPFTSDRKRMEVRARPVNGIHISNAFMHVIQTKNPSSDGSLYCVKGMPESILGDCNTYLTCDGTTMSLSENERRIVITQTRRMASSGLRVLAMGYGANANDLTFAGIVGMEDPPRRGVSEAVRQLQRGGVSIMMVTGDSKETAVAIAKKCGIIQSSSNELSFEGHNGDSSYYDSEVGSGVALSGEELDAIPSTQLAESIIGIKVFYRVAPRHKLALVRAFQSQGEIVAMTGDGVNDAIALKVSIVVRKSLECKAFIWLTYCFEYVRLRLRILVLQWGKRERMWRKKLLT